MRHLLTTHEWMWHTVLPLLSINSYESSQRVLKWPDARMDSVGSNDMQQSDMNHPPILLQLTLSGTVAEFMETENKAQPLKRGWTVKRRQLELKDTIRLKYLTIITTKFSI